MSARGRHGIELPDMVVFVRLNQAICRAYAIPSHLISDAAPTQRPCSTCQGGGYLVYNASTVSPDERPCWHCHGRG